MEAGAQKPRYKRPQSFLRSKAAHELDYFELFSLTEEQAFARFKEVRFAANDGKPYCPSKTCGCDAVYTYRPLWNKAKTISRVEFKCKRCEKRFTATSGTAFHHRKMSFKKILVAIAMFIQFPKGMAALQMVAFLRCDYRAALILIRKLREAMKRNIDQGPFETRPVEADSTEIGGYIRPKNARKEMDPRDPRKTKKNAWKIPYTSKKKLYVSVMRERGPGGRIRTAVTKLESDSPAFVKSLVTKNTTLYTDQATGYQKLAWDVANHFAINHSQSFWTPEANTNTAENYFAMLKRSVRGVYHHISHPDYAHTYTEEQAWRLSNNRVSNLDRFNVLLRQVGAQKKSKYRGFWQRRRSDECANAS
jgi:hypothetical protein